MRMLLQHPPAGTEAPRFVQLTLEQDLFGGWLLLRESGQTGQRSAVKREQFLQRAQAIAAFEQARDANLKRGFRITFAQGEDARA
ncbi:MAG: WGR domain-containing protein [Proteobacteria bacterium]|nr:WGR domain-containing protein [Pseudomonadota bacterium]